MDKTADIKLKFVTDEDKDIEKIYEKAGFEFLNCVPDNKLNEYVEEMLKYFTAEQLISMLFYATQKEEIVDYGKLAERCSKLDMFKSERKTVKTIATCYTRMYNGGVERVLSKLTDMWVKNGYKVVLFTDTEPSKDDYYINPQIVRIVLPVHKWQDADSFEERARVLRENLKKYSVDIMVHHAWNNYCMVTDAMAAKSLGIPFIIHTHGVFCVDILASDWWCAYASGALHKVYSICDLVIALNKSDCAYWNAFGLKCMHTVNPAGIPLDTKQAELNGKNVVMVCRISPEKQVLDGIKIIQEVNKKIPDATITIVGDGDDEIYMASVKNYIKDNNLENVVNMVGSKKDVIPYYQNSDVMLILGRYEGAPMTMVESKICGLPLVSYDIPNLDTLKEAKGIFVVPQNDIYAAADRIVEILSDDTLKKEMGQAARQSAEEIYSVDIAEHWNYIFEQALSKNSILPQSTSDDINAAIKTMVYYSSVGIKERSKEYICRISSLERKMQELEYASKMRISGLEKELETGNLRIKELEKDLNDSQQLSEELSKTLEKLQSDSQERIQDLEATVKEIRHSTSYRIGWFLTTIPRKIKDFIKGQKYVE